MISKSISTSKKLAKVSEGAALLFTWLIPHCDDGGNMDADPMAVKAIVMPMLPVGMPEVTERLTELEKASLVTFYAGKEEERFLHINLWERHQTLRNDRMDIRFPAFDGASNIDGLPDGKPLVSPTEHNITKHNITKQNIPSRPGKRGGDGVNAGFVSQKFDGFWAIYPRKTHRTEAIAVWQEDKAEYEKRINDIVAFIEKTKGSSAWQEKRFIPTAANFLRNRRWEDDPDAYEDSQPPSLDLNAIK